MDKLEILRVLIEQTQADLEHATSAALESAGDATHEEARAEGKYDTRGLETSYLAAGQARHALDLREQLEALKNLVPPVFGPSSPIALGALITTLSSQGRERYFLSPALGGVELETQEGPLTVITAQSPIGRELLGKQTGERIQAGGGKTILKIE